MSLSIIPLVILGQITEASINDDAFLYQMTFKDTNGVPLYGVTAVWTNEQAEIEALAAQKPYGVWFNPIDGTFTVKFAGYTYSGTADLTDPDVLAGITPIVFNNEAAGGGGSGDFSTCTLTITNNTEDYIAVYVPSALDEEIPLSSAKVEVNTGRTKSVSVILYKGIAFAEFPGKMEITTSGDIKVDSENSGFYYISGDCIAAVSGEK